MFFVALNISLNEVGRDFLYRKKVWLLKISAFSSAETRIYFRNVLSSLCPVIFMMDSVGTPAAELFPYLLYPIIYFYKLCIYKTFNL